MSEDNYKEKVEERLAKQQESKEFKDVGRVAQTKKEKAAYRLISSDLLGQLETDSVMAYNMVKKDNVWQPIDVNLEKECGVTSGAAYLKVKVREAVPTRPKDEKQKRASYVLFLERVQKDLTTCNSVKEMVTLFESYRNFSTEQVLGYFIDSEFLNASVERQEEIKKDFETSPSFRVIRFYRGSSLVRKLINEVFGSRFENILFKASDAAITIYKEALDKEPMSHEEAQAEIEKVKERKEKFVVANLEYIENYRNYSNIELIRKMNSDWRIGTENQKRYKSNPDEFRNWVISYYENVIERQVKLFEEKIAGIVQKENDWSWFEEPKGKSESVKEKAKAINTKTPLAYIKRTGGFKIETNTPQEIVDKFGFSAVNYGVYVDDIWSKEHTKHFLGAMSDLGEMLNLNLKQINELGKLGIAFGAKGRPGHLATYFPQTKDINLTKGNGDGSLAHEWGHYFDNVIVELDKKVATNSFASEGLMPDLEIKQLFKELMTFFYKGNDAYTPKVPVTFYRKKIEDAPSYMRRNEFGSWSTYKVEIKNTLEETLESVSDLARMNGDLFRTQIRVYGYIIEKFDLVSCEVPMKIPTSYFYHKSHYNIFRYCGTDEKGNDAIVADTRTKYWTSAVELFARSWETVILKKLLDKKRESNYLVADIPMEDVIAESYTAPYPSGAELEYIESIIDRIIIAVKNKFNIGGFVAPSQEREDTYLDLSTDKKTGKIETGLVITNPEKPKETLTFIDKGEVVKVVEEKKTNPYSDLPLQVVEDRAYELGKTDFNSGKSKDSNQSEELQKMLQAGHAKNVLERAWLNGWNSANADKIDKDFDERFKDDKGQQDLMSERGNDKHEMTDEEDIQGLIDGLEVLAETLSDSERKEIEEVIEGLKLLM